MNFLAEAIFLNVNPGSCQTKNGELPALHLTTSDAYRRIDLKCNV